MTEILPLSTYDEMVDAIRKALPTDKMELLRMHAATGVDETTCLRLKRGVHSPRVENIMPLAPYLLGARFALVRDVAPKADAE